MQRKDRTLKVADANTINSVVAPMALQLHKDRTITVAIVSNANTNAVPTALRRQRDQTLRDVRAQQANMAAVPTALATHKNHNSMAATKFRLYRKKRAVSLKTAALAAITRSNTSSIWNMVAARVSGTVAAEATTIATIQLKSANRRAKRQLEKMLVCYRKYMDHAVATIRCITTIMYATHARNSFMADVWATQIDSKASKIVKNCVLSTNRCVSSDGKYNHCFRYLISFLIWEFH